MASSCCSSWLILALMFFVFANFLFGNGASAANLSTTYYENSCPELLSIVEDALFPELEKEPRMGASLLRLFFHDCFVNGCDGSILLDDTANFTGEKNAILNRNSVRGFHVIDTVKSAVDKACPGIVSCADILAIVARDSVMLLGGPSWETKLGRRDSRTASQADANTYLPSPASNLTTLVSLFAKFGFTVRDMVALSGAHTIGQARCTTFRARLYNDLDVDSEFAKLRKAQCPESQGSGDDNLAPLDIPTEEEFDSAYYANLVFTMGLLHSDQQLYQKQSNGSHGGGGGGDAGSTFTNNLVDEYIRNEASFFSDFALAMIKMGDLNPLTGSTGEIRKYCRVIN